MARFTILALAASTFACVATAGWEDTGAAPSQQPQQIVAAPSATRPAKRYDAPRASTPEAKAFIGKDIYTTFLDTAKVSDQWLRVAYDFNADMENTGKGTAIFELDSHFGICDWYNVLEGDVVFSIDPSLRILTDDCGTSLIPNALVSLPLDFKWTWRYVNGWSFQLGAAPGIYSDVDAIGDLWGALSIPFSGCFYYAFSPTFSGRFGVEIRPDWDMVAMPLVGIAWAPNDTFVMELGVPRTMCRLDFESFDIFAKGEWRSLTYAMSGDDNKPDSFTLEDIAISGGVGMHLSDESRLSIEAGMLVNRSMSYERNGKDGECDMDSAPFFALTFGSNF